MTTSRDKAGLAVAELDDSTVDERLAHLVLKADWPIALCGARVSERFGITAPARDRCTTCLRIASDRGLGRPGWL